MLEPVDLDPEAAELAVCPGSRSAQIYVLDGDQREATAARVAADLDGVPGVDVVARLEDGRAVVGTPRGELRFSPGGSATDDRGQGWDLEGDLEALDLALDAGTLTDGVYPDALRRLWSAVICERTGDLLLSAEPGYEFTDWGGADHVGGGSHGSLHECDSLGVLLTCGVGPERRPDGARWSIEDVTPMVLDHFGVGAMTSAPEPRMRTHTRVREGMGRRHNWVQLVKFGVVGGSGYVVNLAVFAAAVTLADVHHLVAATIAFVVAVSNNFWWNRHWTFGARDGHAGFQAARFFSVSVGAFVFGAAILELLVNVAGVPEIGAQAISIAAATPLNFVGNKMWSFGPTRLGS